jgi:hypothetical protein
MSRRGRSWRFGRAFSFAAGATRYRTGRRHPRRNVGGPRAETGPTTLLETGPLPRLASMATPKSSEMPLSGNFIMSLDENFIKTLIVSYWETLDDYQTMADEL